MIGLTQHVRSKTEQEKYSRHDNLIITKTGQLCPFLTTYPSNTTYKLARRCRICHTGPHFIIYLPDGLHFRWLLPVTSDLLLV